MFTKVLLGAGVAALAIATPAMAGPGGHGNGGGPHGDEPPAAASGGGNRGHGGGPPAAPGGGVPRVEQQSRGGGGPGPRVEMRAAPQMRVERQQMRAAPQMRAERQSMRAERQVRVERQPTRGVTRQQARATMRQNGPARQQMRLAERHQVRMTGRRAAQPNVIDRQSLRTDQTQRQQTLARQALAPTNIGNAAALASRGEPLARVNNDYANAYYGNGGRGLNNGCPPGLAAKNNGCLPPGQAARLLGTSLASAAGIATLAALPQSLSYYYPDTSDYYYRYGDGYLYQVDRGSDLISSLLPLIGGGYLPGTYLPAGYMDSYVPDYYGMNAFYPDYGNVCNRYYNGVIYQADCATGLVEDVVPMYAGGYGVGQLLPASYGYYNVPTQYRSMYYDTPDASYWYAPGAIYQYDPNSSLITSVAALLSPGFSIGQQLPVGYDAYNVPSAYRATYYDTPNAWYRFNNGYIYQVDPTTQLVTAIVASLLS